MQINCGGKVLLLKDCVTEQCSTWVVTLFKSLQAWMCICGLATQHITLAAPFWQSIYGLVIWGLLVSQRIQSFRVLVWQKLGCVSV